MKYFVLVAVLVVAYMMWRNARLAERAARDARPPRRPGTAVGDPQAMVDCAVCGVHLPQTEAVVGARGLMYCSHDHRQRAGG